LITRNFSSSSAELAADVCLDDDLTHDRYDGDVSGLTGFDELAIFRFHFWIEA
jgi:hypothetical protein